MHVHKHLISTILFGCLTTTFGCTPPESTPTDSVEARASATSLDRVAAKPPVRKSLQLFTQQPGRIAAFEEAPLHTKLAGYVEKVSVDIGDRVTKGQLLVKLSIPELNDQLSQKEGLLAQAEAEVQQAEAALEASKAAANSAKALIAQAEAGMGRVNAEYQRWDSERGRIEQLVSSGSVTSKLADETLSQFLAAQAAKLEVTASVESAKASFQQAEANITKAESDVAAAKARVQVALANVATASTMLAYTNIVAPFDGVITIRNVDTGHYVQPANSMGDPLVTVASTDRVRVYVDVPEMEASLLDAGYGDESKGDVATIKVQSLKDQKFEGRVTRTSWSLDAKNRSLRAEIDLPNDNQAMLPGGFANVTILLAERDNVLTLPITSIIRDRASAYCFVVNGGVAKRIPIELGLRSGPEVEIISGLSGSELVVMTNAGSLVDGQQVEVIATK